MPIVRIEMLAGRSADIKQRLAAELTDVVARHCGSDPAHIYVIFNDVRHEDWAVAGRTFAAAPATPGTPAAHANPAVAASAGTP